MTGSLFTISGRLTDSDGNPLVGAKASFFLTETTTYQDVYTTADLSVPHTNPVISDSGGYFPDIYMDPTKSYRVRLATSDDTLIRDTDPVSLSAPYLPVAGGTISGDLTITGDLVVNGSPLGVASGGTGVTTYAALLAAIGGASVTSGVPSGAVMDFAMQTAPAAWLECDGSAVSRTTYAALYTAIGTTWGVGDGTTTFNLPDLRGEFRRSWDHGKGTDSGRTFASHQDDQVEAHKHKTAWGLNPGFGAAPFGSSGTVLGATAYADPGYPHSLSSDGTDSGVNPTDSVGTETRPRNFAVLTCIKV